jgi:hypothetical protein
MDDGAFVDEARLSGGRRSLGALIGLEERTSE